MPRAQPVKRARKSVWTNDCFSTYTDAHDGVYRGAPTALGACDVGNDLVDDDDVWGHGWSMVDDGTASMWEAAKPRARERAQERARVLYRVGDISVYRVDMASLRGTRCLRDTPISAMFHLLGEEFPHHVFASPYLYTLMMTPEQPPAGWKPHMAPPVITGEEAINYARVANHFKAWSDHPRALFQQEKVFIPINVGQAHWVLIVVNLKRGHMKHYDSLGHGDGRACHRMRRVHELFVAYSAEHEIADPPPHVRDGSKWRMHTRKRFRQHPAGNACGAFVVLTAKSVAAGTLDEDRAWVTRTVGAEAQMRKDIAASIVTGELRGVFRVPAQDESSTEAETAVEGAEGDGVEVVQDDVVVEETCGARV